MVLLLLLVLAAVPVFAGDTQYGIEAAHTKDRIFGGVPATIEEFPFIVSVFYDVINKNEPEVKEVFGCGATIITENWVLTVTHCVDIAFIMGDGYFSPDDSVSVKKLRGGSAYTSRGGVVRFVRRIVPLDIRQDIGLIEVDEPWPLNGKTIALARLPRQDDPVPVGDPATIMGWGSTDGSSRHSEILMKQEVVVIDLIHCVILSLPWLQANIIEKCICTLSDPHKPLTTAHWGDSGSPVVSNGQVVGIVSLGTAELSGAPNFHTRVSSYIDWIEENVGPLPRVKW